MSVTELYEDLENRFIKMSKQEFTEYCAKLNLSYLDFTKFKDCISDTPPAQMIILQDRTDDDEKMSYYYIWCSWGGIKTFFSNELIIKDTTNIDYLKTGDTYPLQMEDFTMKKISNKQTGLARFELNFINPSTHKTTSSISNKQA